MSYRDQLDAAQARIAFLDEQLAKAHETIERLKLNQKEEKHKARAEAKKRKRRTKKTKKQKSPHQIGKIYFDRLPTYFPLFHLYAKSLSPSILSPFIVPPPKSDSALLHLVQPVVGLLVVLMYYVFLLVLVPVTAYLVVIYSLPLIPVLFLTAFKVTGKEKKKGPKWMRGEFEEDQARYFILGLPFFTFPLSMFAFLWLLVLID